MTDTHLLPDNSTPLMRTLSEQSTRIDAIDADVIETLWDPARIPAHLLRDLAAWLSVDFWQDAWPDTLKRQMIAQSPEYHAIKGTPRAVEMALRFLGYAVTVLHWWQVGGRRGTFKVVLLATDEANLRMPDLTPDNVRAIFAAVTRAKPKSRAFSVDIGIGFAQSAVVAVASRALETASHLATCGRASDFGDGVVVACASRAFEIVHYTCEANHV